MSKRVDIISGLLALVLLAAAGLAVWFRDPAMAASFGWLGGFFGGICFTLTRI